MDLTTALTGMLPFIVLVSAVLTAIVSALLLWLYRRAVVRSMSGSSGSTLPASWADAPAGPDETAELTITTVGADDPVTGKGPAVYQSTSASLRRLGIVYTVSRAGLRHRSQSAVDVDGGWWLPADASSLACRVLCVAHRSDTLVGDHDDSPSKNHGRQRLLRARLF